MEIPDGHKIINEGRARIPYPANEEGDVPAFYNPAQIFNRDLSCAILEEFAVTLNKERKEKDEKSETKFSVIEALSASGLRACRYALECPSVDKIIANDLSVSAVEEIKQNSKFNSVENKVQANCADAIELLTAHRGMVKNVECIDLDPYGSATPFLDSAVQAVCHGGLLMVTCTDMGVLAGNHPEACFAKYGSFPLKSTFCHEQAIRIVLYAIEKSANRYGRYIEPLISLHLDFFIRVFVRVHFGKIHVKRSCAKIGHALRCPQTHMFTTYRTATKEPRPNDNFKYNAPRIPSPSDIPYCKSLAQGGPYWLEELHNHAFIERVQRRINESDENVWTTKIRLNGLLEACLEELPDVPFYYNMQKDFGIVLKASQIKTQIFRSAVINAGYRISSSHATTDVLKTDAPPSAIWDIFRAYHMEHNKGELKMKDNEKSIRHTILTDKQGDTKIDFSVTDKDIGLSKLRSCIRFPPLPANWGPKAAARMKLNKDVELEPKKAKKGQKRREPGQMTRREQIRENKRRKRQEKKAREKENSEKSEEKPNVENGTPV